MPDNPMPNLLFAEPGIDAVLSIGSAGCPVTYTPIANVGDITVSESAAVVDVTAHAPGAPWRRKVVTLLDAGSCTFPLYFIPDSNGDGGHGSMAGLHDVFTSRQIRSYKLTWPDGTEDFYNTGQIQKFSKKAPVAGVCAADVDIVFSGEPIFG